MLLAFHARSHELLKQLPQPGPPVAIAADGAGGVWVAIRGPGHPPLDTLVHYDVSGQTLFRTSVRQGITAMVLSPTEVWLALTDAPKLMRVDRWTGRTRTTRVIKQARSLTYGGGYVWASAPDTGTVTRVDPRNGRPISTFAGHHPAQLAFTAGRLFVACIDDQALVIFGKSLNRIGRLRMPVNPFAVTADASHVWVAGLGEDTVTRVDVT